LEDESCLLCSEKETSQHLFFYCVVAKQCWALFSELLGTRVGSDIIEIGKFWLSPKKYVLVNIITVVVLWSIWKLRNEICFQRIG
jgi:hypothetical protein